MAYAERNKNDTSAPRRWVAFAISVLCLVGFTVLLLIYALASLPEWLSLVIGAAIVLVFAGMITAIGIGIVPSSRIGISNVPDNVAGR